MDNLVIALKGKIDSNNANEIEQSIKDQIEAGGSAPIVFDLTDLQYVSSAGLRVLLRVRKSHPDMKVINVNSEVYDIFEMTGFTEMMNVEKAYKQLSVEGCEVVGIGANGTVYRLDQDTVVKVYNYPDHVPLRSRKFEVIQQTDKSKFEASIKTKGRRAGVSRPLLTKRDFRGIIS